MTINAEPSKGGKISVYIDGEYLLAVDADTWYSLDYTNGSEISEDELEEFKFLVSARKAYAQALRFLTLRAHSENELYKKLLKKQYSEKAAEYAIKKCGELGFIDDEDFAGRYAAELVRNKHFGLARIKNELRLKGIDGEIIDKTLRTLDFDPVDSITEVIDKKYSNCLGDEKGKRKTVSALMRMGYSYGDIKKALSDYDLPEED